MTWHTFLTTTAAGAPPGCPAAASQSRNWPKTVSWIEPYLDMQSLKSAALESQTSWKVMGSQPPPLAAAAFTKILDRVLPDVVHIHSYTRAASLATVEQARKRGIPVVFTYHTPTVSCARGTLIVRVPLARTRARDPVRSHGRSGRPPTGADFRKAREDDTAVRKEDEETDQSQGNRETGETASSKGKA